MSPYDIAAIERHARQLRAEEIRRINGLFADYLCVVGRVLAAIVSGVGIALAEAIRLFFSWSPQDEPARTSATPQLALAARAARAKHAVRRLFSWNPEVHHHV